MGDPVKSQVRQVSSSRTRFGLVANCKVFLLVQVQQQLPLQFPRRRMVAGVPAKFLVSKLLELHSCLAADQWFSDLLAASAPTSPAIAKKDGRGRPRKSLPTNGATSVAEPQTEESIVDEKPKPKAEPTTDSAPLIDTGRSYWLMKAEPESRLEKGVDVKFSIDDLAAAHEPEPWDGMFSLTC